MNRQQAKESACLLAIRQGFGLIRRGTEIHGISAAGCTKLLSRSNDIDTVWHDAVEKLRQLGGSEREVSRKRVDPYELPQDDGWIPTSRGTSEGFFGIKS